MQNRWSCAYVSPVLPRIINGNYFKFPPSCVEGVCVSVCVPTIMGKRLRHDCLAAPFFVPLVEGYVAVAVDVDHAGDDGDDDDDG